MRYAQGGGLTAERRQFRERVRCEAGERFARGDKTAVIAEELRVSERSVERWRRAWREGGMAALAARAGSWSARSASFRSTTAAWRMPTCTGTVRSVAGPGPRCGPGRGRGADGQDPHGAYRVRTGRFVDRGDNAGGDQA
ncbi:helix-turn-helix domain-containing protein [Streptomyces sp. MNP-20]|uniref:helix-turn-helix domain-containing protein n=1 Tax=Streptomyces sp. MNP-20 TaxID=2721165 RepID=UPI0020A64405|nr:helix-turn-helix domain-containing protein [Streptomyces sp. MNP-20]